MHVLEVELDGLPAELDGLRVAHLSDFHLGPPGRGARRADVPSTGSRSETGARLRHGRPGLAPARRAVAAGVARTAGTAVRGPRESRRRRDAGSLLGRSGASMTSRRPPSCSRTRRRPLSCGDAAFRSWASIRARTAPAALRRRLSPTPRRTSGSFSATSLPCGERCPRGVPPHARRPSPRGPARPAVPGRPPDARTPEGP